jgi:hypothetical protein
MAQFKYAFYRRSIVSETFFVEADSEDEAFQKLMDGEDPEPEPMEWVDWYDDQYHRDDCIEPEPLCPLHKMVKEYSPTA